MAEQEYFKKALADFAFDAAAGGAIRHLADNGLTVRQIAERLAFPVSEEKIGRVVWEHFLTTGRIRREEPGNGTASEEYTYVTEYDAYGRKSFRRVLLAQHAAGEIRFREVVYDPAHCGGLYDYLAEKCAENGEEKSYVSCRFGRGRGTDTACRPQGEEDRADMECRPRGEEDRADMECRSWAEGYGADFPAGLSAVLGQRERDYLAGLPWEDGVVYHRLDRRMREIVARLYGAGLYRGECWFLESGERLVL